MAQHELGATVDEVRRAWCEAMRLPAEIVEHDVNTKTIKELAAMLCLSTTAAQSRASQAVTRETMQEVHIQETLVDGRQYIVKAYRLMSKGGDSDVIQ
jgi:hypothetical protein